MSERTIVIKTYDTIENPLRFDAKIFMPTSNFELPVPSNLVLNLNNLFKDDGSKLSLRQENEDLLFKFRLLFEEGFTDSDLGFLVNEDETAYKTLSIRIQATCKKTKWCSTQKRVSLAEIGRKDYFEIELPLNEIKEVVSINYFITRETPPKRTNRNKATNPYSIVATGEEVKILVDEVKEIGGNHFPINPKEGMGDLLFRIDGLEQSLTIPEIFFNDEMKDYFTRSDLMVVNSSFLMFSFYILDTYLKWLIFSSFYDENDKDFKSLLELYSTYCGVPKHKISEVVNFPKHSEEQTKEYLILSNNLFKGVQVQKSLVFKKEIKSLIKEEVKLKAYETV